MDHFNDTIEAPYVRRGQSHCITASPYSILPRDLKRSPSEGEYVDQNGWNMFSFLPEQRRFRVIRNLGTSCGESITAGPRQGKAMWDEDCRHVRRWTGVATHVGFEFDTVGLGQVRSGHMCMHSDGWIGRQAGRQASGQRGILQSQSHVPGI